MKVIREGEGWSDLGAEPSNWSAFGRGEFPATSFGTSSNYREMPGVKSGSARRSKGEGEEGTRGRKGSSPPSATTLGRPR